MVAPPAVEISVHILSFSPSPAAVLMATGTAGVLAQLAQSAWKSNTEVSLSLPAGGPVELSIHDPALPGIKTIPGKWIEPAHTEISV